MSDTDSTKGGRAAEPVSDEVAADDPHKIEKLTKQGRDDLDPDEGSD